MSFDVQPYFLLPALLHWLTVFGLALAIAAIVGFVAALATFGARGPQLFFEALGRGFQDLTRLSTRRIFAISSLTFRESTRRKALHVMIVGILLFMFAHWFLDTPGEDLPAKPFVSFVLTLVRWMVIPVSVLLACWGLPADIKDRSLHTVVTKPVRRSEIVLGRMLGYAGVTTIVLVALGFVGYLWILRVVPTRSQSQLISRVPIYAQGRGMEKVEEKDTPQEIAYKVGKVRGISFLGREGEVSESGVNTGDVWMFRTYLEGGTKARAFWTFQNLDTASLEKNGKGKLLLEEKFEAFRTHKGTIGEQVRFEMWFHNPKKGLRVKYPPQPIEVREYTQDAKAAVIEIPQQISYRSVDENGVATQKQADLFKDLMDDGKMVIEIGCVDHQQYVGVARTDLFIRLPDRSFAVGYFKSVLSIWLMSLLIIMLGCTASCFLKGPVSTMLTFGLVLVGQGMRSFMLELLTEFRATGMVTGGGPLESIYRMVKQMNVQTPLPENAAKTIIEKLDYAIFRVVDLLQNIIPNFNYYDTGVYVANGFDVSWDAALLPSLALTIAYILPCLLLGYFSLQLRELESK